MLARELLGPQVRGARDAQREAVAAAKARGETTVDIQARASVGMPCDMLMLSLARTYVALIDEADAYCRVGLPLTMPPHRHVTELRHWFVKQLAVQLLDGHPPAVALSHGTDRAPPAVAMEGRWVGPIRWRDRLRLRRGWAGFGRPRRW